MLDCPVKHGSVAGIYARLSSEACIRQRSRAFESCCYSCSMIDYIVRWHVPPFFLGFFCGTVWARACVHACVTWTPCLSLAALTCDVGIFRWRAIPAEKAVCFVPYHRTEQSTHDQTRWGGLVMFFFGISEGTKNMNSGVMAALAKWRRVQRLRERQRWLFCMAPGG